MQTHAERFRHMMQEWSLTQEELGNLCGIKRGTVGTIVNGKTVPDVEALARLKQAKPELSWDWLLLGIGSMLCDGRYNEKPAPVAPQEPAAHQPAPGLVSGPATVAEAENILLRERIADKDVIIEMLRAELGKSNDSLDAADTTAPTSPLAPRSSAGFKLTAIEKALRESFQEKQELVEAE